MPHPRHRLRHARHAAQMSGYAGGTELIWLPDDAPTSKVAYYGAPQTITVMRKAALDDAGHIETRRCAEEACEWLDSKDYTSEYLALYHFILKHTRYMRDPRRVEFVRAPYVISRMILDGHRPSVDCDDVATWLAAAIMSVGGRAEFNTVAFAEQYYDGQPQYSHVFTTAIEPRRMTRIVLDPVAAEKTREMLGRVKMARVWGIAA